MKHCILTAALTVAGSLAVFGWEFTHLKANIEFPFRAYTADMPAGHYDVTRENVNGTARFYLRNAETRKAVMLIASSSKELKGNARPSASFSCNSAHCGLVSITTGDKTYRTVAPKMAGSDKERLVTVYFDRVTGD